MIYVKRCVVPGRFMRAVRSVFAYVVGRQSVTAGEVMRIVRPASGIPAGMVFFPVWRALDYLSGSHATYDDFLGLCLKELCKTATGYGRPW